MTPDTQSVVSPESEDEVPGGSISTITVADLGNNLTQVGCIYQIPGGPARFKLTSMPSARSLTGASLKRARELRGGTLGKDDHVLGFSTKAGGLIEEYVGDLALTTNASAARGSDTRYTDGWTSRPMLAGICATHPPKALRISTKLYTIVPWNLWRFQAADVANALSSTWSFQYNGTSRSVRIPKALVEGEGKIGYAALVKERPEIAKGTMLGIDWGARTVCVALYVNGIFEGAAQIELGIDFLLDDVEFPRQLTARELVELKDALRDKKPYTIRHNHRDVRIDEIARVPFPTAVERLIQEVAPTIEIGTADQVALYGGGAYFTKEDFTEQQPNMKLWVPKKPEQVNLRALLELAKEEIGTEAPNAKGKTKS